MNLKFLLLLNSKLFMSLLKEIAFHFDPPPPTPINNADILFFIFFCHLVKLMSEFSTELFI